MKKLRFKHFAKPLELCEWINSNGIANFEIVSISPDAYGYTVFYISITL